jgi:hypothetical protein
MAANSAVCKNVDAAATVRNVMFQTEPLHSRTEPLHSNVCRRDSAPRLRGDLAGAAAWQAGREAGAGATAW